MNSPLNIFFGTILGLVLNVWLLMPMLPEVSRILTFFVVYGSGYLQGFPDGWTECGADGKKMSDSARYRALGNAVTVDFPRMIGEKLR